jgi:Protein of unknown function (DUF2934)
MSTRYNNGSHYENHQRAAELHDLAAHAHRVGEGHGEGEHLTSHERSRPASDHSRVAYRETQAVLEGHGIGRFGHTEIANLAKELWKARGCPEGSPEQDWFNAVSQLRVRYLAEREIPELIPG